MTGVRDQEEAARREGGHGWTGKQIGQRGGGRKAEADEAVSPGNEFFMTLDWG